MEQPPSLAPGLLATTVRCRFCSRPAADAGVTQRDLTSFYVTFRPCGLGTHLLKSELKGFVCAYCWVRASQCIKFLECVRAAEMTLNNACQVNKMVGDICNLSECFQGLSNICNRKSCRTNGVSFYSDQPDHQSSPFSDNILCTDSKNINNVKHKEMQHFEVSSNTKIDNKKCTEEGNNVFNVDYKHSHTQDESTDSENVLPLKYLRSGVDKDKLKKKKKVRMKTNQSKNDRKVVEKKSELVTKRLKILGIEEIVLPLKDQLAEIEQVKRSDKYIKSKYPCDMCGAFFEQPEKYEIHQMKHDESAGAWPCAVCRRRLTSARRLAAHAARHARRWRCARCGVVLRARARLRFHYEQCARAVAACTQCSATFSTTDYLKRHVRVVHDRSKRYSCDQCGKSYNYMHGLTRHLRSHAVVKPFVCPVCARRSASSTLHRQHLKVHEPYQEKEDAYCVECDQYFKSHVSLGTHLATSLRHVSKHSYRHGCDECPERFPNASALRLHVNTRHLNVRPFSCRSCDKAYFTRGALKKHQDSRHTEVERRPEHICADCNKAFLSKTTLSRHTVAVHRKERPYACDICGATFGFRSALFTHKKLKHKIRSAVSQPSTYS